MNTNKNDSKLDIDLAGTSNHKFELKFSNEYFIEKIKELESFFSKNSITYPDFDFFKWAYPNSDYFLNVPGEHNTQKWLDTVKNIYYMEKKDEDRVSAIKKATDGWKFKEKYDFLNWLKFYEEGAHLKYKIANNLSSPGYFLPTYKDFNSSKDEKYEDFEKEKRRMSEEEKLDIISKQRKKIISRLNAIEKILGTTDGHLFAGNELESLIDSIFDLKKKVNIINKKSTSLKTYEDLFIRQGNILANKGFYKAANLLFSLADEVPATAANSGAPSNPANPPNPAVGAGLPGTLPANTNPNSSPAAEQTNSTPSMVEKNNLDLTTLKSQNTNSPTPQNTSVQPNESTQAVQNKNESVSDNALGKFEKRMKGDLNQSSDFIYLNEDELLSNAQIASPPAPPIAPIPLPKNNTKLEITEEDIENKSKRDFDLKMNDIFSKITIDDVIIKLEDLAKIFKTREIPRQLSIVDMMLDSLGLASYFPSLSEATNKALDSNNYISTRIEDVLSKLRGASKTQDIDLKGDVLAPSLTPEAKNIKSKLEDQENKEKAKKELKKKQEDEALELETPEIEISEDLEPATENVQNIAPISPPAPTTNIEKPLAVKPQPTNK